MCSIASVQYIALYQIVWFRVGAKYDFVKIERADIQKTPRKPQKGKEEEVPLEIFSSSNAGALLIYHGPWTMVHRPWSMGDGRWTMVHGAWSIDHGLRTMVH